MDQIAPVIRWIKKNVFWLGCAFLAIAMVAMWFVTSGALAKETAKNEGEVKNQMRAAQNILTVKPGDIEEGGAHPNQVSEEGMRQELSDTIDSIVDAWTIRKKAQEKILEWPSCIPNKQFVEFFGKYNPPETFPDEWTAGLRTQPMLELYRTKIPEQMIYLCGDDVLRTRWNYDPANMDAGTGMGLSGDDDDEYDDDEEDDEEYGFGGRGGGGFGGRGGGPPGGFGGAAGGLGGSMASAGPAIDWNKYAVRWSDKNQALWWSKLTQFQGRDGNQFMYPKPLQCYMLQQDLWLLEAMFRIIREVNGDSNANDLSPIKAIDHVVFGREVGGKLGELTEPDQRLAGKQAVASSPFGGGDDDDDDDWDDYEEDEDDEDMGAMFSRSKGGIGAPTDGMSDGGGMVATAPYDMLYVDTNYEPLPADIVKSVITGSELPEENLELIVAKRIPVRIALKMDERRIADFMAACANSPFAFEIQQVRWNRHTPGGDEIVLGGASGFGPGGGGDRGKGMGGMGQDLGMDFGSDAASLTTTSVEVRTGYDVNVEFFGVVKIYNPVREDELRRAAGLTDDTMDPIDAASTANPNASGDSTKP